MAEETFQVSFEEYIRFSGGEEEKELQAERLGGEDVKGVVFQKMLRVQDKSG